MQSLSKQRILLVSFGIIGQVFLKDLIAALEKELGISVELAVSHYDLTRFYDPARRQYDANKIIHYLHDQYRLNEAKVIGILPADIFIPILTYVIGQAVFNGSAGVVSFFRLKNELYGLKQDERLLFDRFYKEVLHEIGHIFGLRHCVSPVCIMRPATYVEEVDEKKPAFCENCRTFLDGELAAIVE